MYWSTGLTYGGINMVYFCKHGDEFFLHKGQGISIPDKHPSPSQLCGVGSFVEWQIHNVEKSVYSMFGNIHSA
jgi:hypothetical protein